MVQELLDLNGKSVMVTGGAGFIGSHLVDALIRENIGNLVVVDNLFLGKESNLSQARSSYPKLRFYNENVGDINKIRPIFESENIDVVFNLAVIPLLTSLEEPIWTWDENIKITESICELAREKLFDTLIHFSSSEAYGSAKYYPMREDHPMNPTTPYAASKAAADLLVNSYVCTFGIDASIVRPFNNYGPRQNEGSYAGIIPIVIQKILSGKAPIIFGDGNQTRDFIFVGDVARAAIMAYKNIRTRKKAINIATGKEISINDLVRIMAKVMKYDGEIIYDAPRPGDVRQHWADISLAWNILGFEPNVGFEEGISDTVDWYIKKLNEI